jgi:hypothetical protein
LKFRLLYEGEIKPRQRAGVANLHAIRMQLHPQIKELWQYPPLSPEPREKWLRESTSPGDYGILERANGVPFIPLISRRNDLTCELDITLLRQQAPGQLLGDGGDIDNRMKTLLDGLRKPSTGEAQQVPITPRPDNDPIHCLLQDDALVTRLNVDTDRLLRPTSSKFDLVAIIQVTVVLTRVTFGNIGLLSRAQ